ncbi:MAG: AAA family ATPase [Candidatus Micrarchaeota archaeon]
MPSFSELAAEQKVFRDKAVLSPHFVPSQLLYRDDEIRKVMQAVAPALHNSKARNLFVYGKTGSGKTCVAKHVLQKLEEEKNLRARAVYLNCRIYDSRYKVLQKVISSFSPDSAKTGYSFALLYERFLDWIEGLGEDGADGKHVILVLDEVDVVKDLDNLIYTLTRANDDLKKGSVSVIGISNKVNFKQRLDVRSKSSLCEEEAVFQPYDANQLKGILSQRLPSAFNDGVVQPSALNLAAAIAAGDNGDARYALALLLRAGEVAEKKKLDHVSDKEVEDARKAADEDKAAEVVSSLPEHQKLVLYALAVVSEDVHYKKLVEEEGEKYYFSGEVYERYRAMAKKMGQEPRTSRWYREYLHELETLGLINSVESGKGVRGHATLLRLAYDAPKVKRILEKTLVGE